MGKKKYFSKFIRADTDIKDKDKAVDNFIRYWLDRCYSMFEYKNLPESIPQKNLELYLLTQGQAYVTEVNGELLALNGTLSGELNQYYEYTQYIVVNPYIKLDKVYDIEKDGVLCLSDSMMSGILPLLNKYGVLLSEMDLSIRSAIINTRLQTIISASDDKTKASADVFMDKIIKGDVSIIGENAFFDGVNVHNSSVNTNYLTQLIELNQYLKASLYNELGLNANYNMKREYIGKDESALNDDVLLPLCDDMLKNRRIFCDKINEKYNTNIQVDYDSSWKVNDSEQEKQQVIDETIDDTKEEEEEKPKDDSDDKRDDE